MKYLTVLGILAFVYILSLLDYNLVLQSIRNLDMKYLFYYSISFYIFYFLKVYRWHLIQNYFSKPLTFKQNSWVFLETLYLSYVTPAKLGDIARLWIIKKYFNIDKKDSLVAYIFDRIQDIFFLLLCALFGLIFIVDIEISNYIYLIFVLLILLYIFKNKVLNIFKQKFNFTKDIQTDVRFEIKIFILNSTSFFFYFLQVYLLAKAMNLNIEYSFVIALVSISAIATLIPISISGLGVREGVFIYLLATIGITKENAVVLSLLDNVVFAAVFIIILHLFAQLSQKKNNLFKRI